MRKIIIRGAIVVVILLAGTGVFQWHNYQQKIEYRKEALLYFKEEDYSKTISYLEEALKRQSVFAREIDLDMTCYLAESHYQLKEYDKAEKIYNKLINNDSKNAQYYMLKGECVAKSGDAQGAVKVYEQGWNHTQDTDFLEKICEIYVEKQNYDKSLICAGSYPFWYILIIVSAIPSCFPIVIPSCFPMAIPFSVPSAYACSFIP